MTSLPLLVGFHGDSVSYPSLRLWIKVSDPTLGLRIVDACRELVLTITPFLEIKVSCQPLGMGAYRAEGVLVTSRLSIAPFQDLGCLSTLCLGMKASWRL